MELINNITYVDMTMILVLLFSGYLFIRQHGLKKGLIFLLVLLFVGGILGIISKYANETGKLLLIFFILVCGLFWQCTFKKNE